MGKWSANRRRGSTPPRGAALPAPQTPDLYVDEGVLKSESFDIANTDGTFSLDKAFLLAGPYIPIITVPWSTIIAWGDEDGLDPAYYRSVVHGGGVELAGDSEPSVVYQKE